MPLNLENLKEMVELDSTEDIVTYARSQGVEIEDDYDDTIELINEQSDVLAGNAKLRLLQMLYDLADELETIEELETEFAERTVSGGWTDESPTVSEQTAVVSGYSSYSDSRWGSQKSNGMPFMMYVAFIDGNTTSGCKALNRKVFEIKDSQFRKYIYPPRHWNCRSIVVALDKFNGTVSKANQFKQYYAEPEFRKKAKAYNWRPDPNNFTPNLYRAYEQELS